MLKELHISLVASEDQSGAGLEYPKYESILSNASNVRQRLEAGSRISECSV